MYQQRDTSSRWVLGVAILIAVLAIFSGLTLHNSSWLNPSIGDAQARAIEEDTDYQTAVHALQLRDYESQINNGILARDEQTRTALIRDQQETEYQAALNRISLEMRQKFAWAGMIALVIAALGLGAGFIRAGARLSDARVPVRNPGEQKSGSLSGMRIYPATVSSVQDPWMSEQYRIRQRNQARRNERIQRQKNLKAGQSKPELHKKGKEERTNLPWAM